MPALIRRWFLASLKGIRATSSLLVNSMAIERRMAGAKRRYGDAADGADALATKWLNRIAQGFSPGFDRHRGCALKGRPK